MKSLKESAIVIRDVGDKVVDRYTAYRLRTPRDERELGGTIPMIAFNDRPFHPQGFGQHTCGHPGKHLGKRIRIGDLSDSAQKFVMQEFNIRADK